MKTNLLYKTRGGGWFGNFSATWPFVLLSMYEDRLEIQRPSLSGTATEVLAWNDIRYAKRLLIVPFIADGVYVVPNDPATTSFTVFWSLSGKKCEKILSILQEHGVSSAGSFSSYVYVLRIFTWALLGVIVLSIILAVFLQ